MIKSNIALTIKHIIITLIIITKNFTNLNPHIIYKQSPLYAIPIEVYPTFLSHQSFRFFKSFQANFCSRIL